MSFTSIPVLDSHLARDPETKADFLEQLREVLMEVGFFYLKNVGIPDDLLRNVASKGKEFFEIPTEEKERIDMKHSPSFLGYSCLSSEVTAGKIDYREQIELSTEHPLPKPGAPLYHNFLAPNQWPSEEFIPEFRSIFTDYMSRMGEISTYFTSLIAESIQLPANAFDKYFDADQQHKLKILKYPDMADLGQTDGLEQSQGVGPHKDSMLVSYLLQATPHHGLQAQNLRGEWIDCPPMDDTLVVAIGQSMEALTQGVCVATTHRVLSPIAGTGARFSMPFFQGVRLDAEFDELESVGIGKVPEEMHALRRKVIEKNGGRVDDVKFSLRKGSSARYLGEALLRIRTKAYPQVGERWYPDILKAIREEQGKA